MMCRGLRVSFVTFVVKKVFSPREGRTRLFERRLSVVAIPGLGGACDCFDAAVCYLAFLGLVAVWGSAGRSSSVKRVV
jgi:hypothetical protein